MSKSPQIVPFQVNVSQDTVDWIQQRVQTARVIPDPIHPKGEEWADGTPSATVQELVDYWKENYDWRKVEAKINATYNMFTLEVEEGDELINLHFVHHRSENPKAIPLLYAHGWPGNFTEVEHLLDLTDPKDPNEQAFHIIAPSLPGFVFSSPPKATGFGMPKIAAVYHKLMLALGYSHYVAQGGDWGSFVIRTMANAYPEACVGVHLNFLSSLPPSPTKHPLVLLNLILRRWTPEEGKRLARLQWFLKEETAYMKIQGSKPQSISYGLLDSPVGMLAWIREKMDEAVDPGYTWDKETIITWTVLYLLSNSSWHARLYKEATPEKLKGLLTTAIPAKVAVGASCFPRDFGFIPRWWAEATLAQNIVFWKMHDKGGHWPSVECPEALKKDILEFVAQIPEARKAALYQYQ